jgi:hypothetical protein
VLHSRDNVAAPWIRATTPNVRIRSVDEACAHRAGGHGQVLIFLLALAPLLVALLEIGLIARFMGDAPRGRPGGTSSDAARSAQHLRDVLAATGVWLEATGRLGEARIELICRDSRPIVGGRWVVHALTIDDPSAAASADVLILAERVWRARGVKGVLVANGFTAQARAAVRTATQVIDLLTWNELSPVRRSAPPAEMPLMAGPRAP